MLMPRSSSSKRGPSEEHNCHFLTKKGKKEGYEYFIMSLSYDQQYFKGAEIHCFNEED